MPPSLQVIKDTMESCFACIFSHLRGIRGKISFFLHIYNFYVLMCVYVSRTSLPSSRAIKMSISRYTYFHIM